MTGRLKREPFVSQVFRYMTSVDDFVTGRQIELELKLGGSRVSSALHYLYRRHAIDVIAQDDTLFWYATPDEDRRTKTIAEKVEEPPGNRKRKCGPHPRRKHSELPKRK